MTILAGLLLAACEIPPEDVAEDDNFREPALSCPESLCVSSDAWPLCCCDCGSTAPGPSQTVDWHAQVSGSDEDAIALAYCLASGPDSLALRRGGLTFP